MITIFNSNRIGFILKLNFYNLMLFNKLKNIKPQSFNIKNENKIFYAGPHSPSSVREWKNSNYTYNKNTLSFIPYAESITKKILKAYFSLYNKNLDKLSRAKKILNRLKKYSSNKIYISEGDYKHTNNKVIIDIYTFNRQEYNIINYIKIWYSSLLNKHLAINLVSKLNSINKESTNLLRKINNDKLLIAKTLEDKVFKHKYSSVSSYISNFYKTILNRSMKKIKMYYYYKQLLYINSSINNYNILQFVKIYLEKIYNKNVEFNIVNLKRFYLNSAIMSESLTLKISRNRRKLLGYMNNLKGKIKIKKKKIYLGGSIIEKNSNVKQDITYKNIILENIVLDNIKYKDVTGFRLQAKGRLTRRFTASRSISKIKYKGNLLDIDSSYRGLSTKLLRGNIKSNLQLTRLSYKTRIGSFGIKGWISGN